MKKLLALCLMLSLFATVCSLTPLAFEEDFSNGLGIFIPQNKSFHYDSGTAANFGVEGGTALTLPYALPEQVTLDIRLRLQNKSGWSGLFFTNGSTVINRFLVRQDCVTNYIATGETGYWRNILDTSLWYDLRMEVGKSETTLYCKPAAADTYTKICTVPRTGKGLSPTFTLQTYACEIAVDSIKLWRPQNDAFAIADPLVSMASGSTCTLLTQNPTGAVTWSVDNSSIATVNENGVISALSAGTTTVTAACDNSSSTVTLVVYNEIESLSFFNPSVTLHEGEVVNQQAIFAPSDAVNQAVIWESSDPAVASIERAPASLNASVVAVSPGVAVITARTPLGDIQNSFDVVVYPKEDSVTSSALFEVTGEHHTIPERLFGIHQNPGDNSASSLQTIRDVGFTSIRSFWASSSLSATDYYTPSKAVNVPLVVELHEFPSASVDSLLAAVKTANETKPANDVLMVELGNECYDGSMSLADYIAKGKELYAAIKAYDSDILVSAVITDTLLQVDLKTWNPGIAAEDFYDAVSVHCYHDFMQLRAIDTSVAASSAFAYSRYHEMEFQKIEALFPGKQIWVTEHGYLQLNMFGEPEIAERNRLQFGKTVGVAISNVERIFGMARFGNVQVSNYHCLNDSQAFGLVQGDSKLPNYYAFEEAGRLFNAYDTFYHVDPVKCDNITEGFIIKGNTSKFADFTMPIVDAFGFGDGTRIQEVAIINTSNAPVTYSLKGYSLGVSWQYGGENAFDGYLRATHGWLDVPVFELPNEWDNVQYQDTILLPPYSMTVAMVGTPIGQKFMAMSVADGSKNVPIDTAIKVTPATPVDSADVSSLLYMEANGVNVPLAVTAGENDSYYVMPDTGFSYNTAYDFAAGDTVISFTTERRPDGHVTIYQNAAVRTSGFTIPSVTASDFQLTFTLKRSESNPFVRLNVGDTPVFLSENVSTYYHSAREAGYVFGHYPFTPNAEHQVKVVKSGPSLHFYARSDSRDAYLYFGSIYGRTLTKTSFGFAPNTGGQVSDIVIQTPATPIAIARDAGDKLVYIDRLIDGINLVKPKASASCYDTVYAMYQLDGTLWWAQTGNEDTWFEVAYVPNEPLIHRFFAFHSLDTLRPLS